MSRTKAFTPKVVTANLLREGDVVYLTASDEWIRDLAGAEIVTNEVFADLRLAFAEDQPDIVVGAYLADVTVGPDGATPAHFREAFRAAGPTNYPHGKAHGQRPGPESGPEV